MWQKLSLEEASSIKAQICNRTWQVDVIFHPEITIHNVYFGDCSRAWLDRGIWSSPLPLLFLKKVLISLIAFDQRICV